MIRLAELAHFQQERKGEEKRGKGRVSSAVRKSTMRRKGKKRGEGKGESRKKVRCAPIVLCYNLRGRRKLGKKREKKGKG